MTKSLSPELDLIKDSKLRQQVVDAFSLCCDMGGYESPDDIPTEVFEQLPGFSNTRHQRETARIAYAMVKELNGLGAGLNEDYVVAGAIAHDVGKGVEWKNNQPGILTNINPSGAGTFYGENPNMPPLPNETHASYQIARHSVWGFYIAMTVGMPEHVAHIILAHSLEGNLYLRTREAIVVKEADEIWWEQIAHQAYGKWPDVDSPFEKGKVYRKRVLDWKRGPE